MLVKIHVEVFWVVTLNSIVVGYQQIWWTMLPPSSNFILNMEATWSYEMLVSHCRTTWHQNPEDLNVSSIEVPCLLWNLNVYYFIHNSPPLDLIF